jgi:acetoacetate decarboxylase
MGMFKFSEDLCYLMPAHFGGNEYPGPNAAIFYRDVVTLSYLYATDGNRLAAFLPEGFDLMRPDLHVSYSQCREIDWMAGGSYNLVQIGVPVRFTGGRDRLEGEFALVIWENKTAPIIGGREQTGMPKIYADIEDLHIIEGGFFTNACHEGNTFLRLTMVDAAPIDDEQLSAVKASQANINNFGWRYIPKVGGPGADLSQPILYPASFETRAVWTGTGTVEWTTLDWVQNPLQWHIIKALAELPMKEMAPVIMAKGTMILKPMQGRVLE